ncbi:MAG: hypothetical protein WBE13_12835 [Candidatus Acidiferrum sp.]
MPRKRKSYLYSRARSCKSHSSHEPDAAARKWLNKRAASVVADETQQKLHAAAERYVGALSDGHPADAKSVRRRIRQRLKASWWQKKD